ncbi:Uncharacterized protein MCB1EB_0912 [Mycoavidus cysteinexigens]|uniref:Uncharacterized protein n=1 Tax=Mycoavidus cysteinexigens TaxID=1553431 RepID=A0A2Z6EUC9_9BURK|nr:hemagglutinin repeat-containing protein [Mycoavidus cysteinexigens]BBE09073.1 Uncharacterized protein MCB1EB_0912 [Mycoavidus cysteinexigens]GAM52192.1 putative large exoprotein involved in heme utilization or adhesion of ShlA/HecA/FhaA family [bacterium endosymbiont of Mortierella elongata FMR23-6]GLR00262.1 adhesin [Mycoavidus cysteinexigens]
MNPIQNIPPQFSKPSSSTASQQTTSSNREPIPERDIPPAVEPEWAIIRSPQLQSDLTLKIVLHEVTGRMPVEPNLFIKIAGQPAEMSSVEADGTTYWGYRFFNHDRVVLTTGSPVWRQNGGLDALSVTEGQMTIRYGAKLKRFAQLDLIADSIKIEGEVQAQRIRLLSGANQLHYTEARGWENVFGPQLAGQTELPDRGRQTVAQQAKVRAERELWISSQGDLVNQGTLRTDHGDLRLTGAGTFTNDGGLVKISKGAGVLTVDVAALSNVSGDIFHQGDGEKVEIKATDLNNQAGAIRSNNDLTLSIRALEGSGVIKAKRDLSVSLQNDYTHTDPQALQAGRHLSFKTQGKLIHQSVLHSSGEMHISAAEIETHPHSSIDSFSTTIKAEKIINQGVIRGGSVKAEAQLLNNEKGRIEAVGEIAELILKADEIKNSAAQMINGGRGKTHISATGTIENSQSGVIFGKGETQLTASSIVNHSERQEVSRTNQGGVIASSGALTLNAQKLENRLGTIYQGALATIPSGTMDDRGKFWTDEVKKRQADQAENLLLADKHAAKLELRAVNELENTGGHIIHTSGGDTQITAGQFKNNAGHDEQVESPGLVIGYSNLTLQAHSVSNGQSGQLLAGGNWQISSVTDLQSASSAESPLLAQGDLVNQGVIVSGKRTSLDANQIDNQTEALIKGEQVLLKAKGKLINKGLIYGNTVAVGAQTLSNFESNYTINGYKPSVIAADRNLDIGAKWLENKDHSLLFSGGDMAIGLQLDAHNQAVGKAIRTTNSSATVDAGGQLLINTFRLINKTAYFKTRERVVDEQFIIEVQPEGSTQRYRLDQLAWDASKGGRQVVKDGTAGSFADYTEYGFMRIVKDTVVEECAPATIQAGGDITLSGRVLNDKSKLIAGGAIRPLDHTFEMEDNRDAVNTITQTDIGLSRYTHSEWHGYLRGRDRTYSAFIDYRLSSTEQRKLDLTLQAEGGIVQHENPDLLRIQAHDMSGAMRVRDASQNGLMVPSLPTSGMHIVQTAPEHSVLVEIDPRFHHAGAFLSSNYLLDLLGINPRNAPKRLGGGFYEQQLIRAQSIALTGQYALSYSRNQRAEYQALMRAGAEYAQLAQLELGAPLTAEQQALLPYDMVWLVSQTVRLPDGSKQIVLAPKVYLSGACAYRPQLGGSGIAASEIDLVSQGVIKNAGTMISTGKIHLDAQNIDNRRGTIVSLDRIALHANEDIDGRAGVFAGQQLSLQAERDIHLESQTRTTYAASGSVTTLDGLTHIQAEQLEVRAKRNLDLAAARVEVSQAAILEAGHDLNLGTAETATQQQLIWDARNSLSQSRKTEVGAHIQTGASLELKAGHDFNAAGTYVSVGGDLSIQAGRDINLEAAYEEQAFAESHYHEFDHLFSSSSELTQTKQRGKQALSGLFSGDKVELKAGRNLNAVGSKILSEQRTDLSAGQDVVLDSATQIAEASHYTVTRRSGLLDAGHFGYAVGEREQKSQVESEHTPQVGTMIGSVSGDVYVKAGNEYRQSGSQLVVPAGDIKIQAAKGKIDAAYEQGQIWQHSEYHQSGLMASLSAPVIAAAQTNHQMLQASPQASDPRMQALAAGAGALATKNAYDAIKMDPKAAGGATVSVMIGEDHCETEQMQLSKTALNSTLAAGGNISIQISGLGEESTLDLIGPRIVAKQDIALNVEGRLNVEAAPNSLIEQSQQRSQSSAVGMAATLGSQSSIGASMAVSAGHGHADEAQINYTPALIQAGGRLMLNAQSDVRLKGAQIAAEQVKAQIEGDLEIESVQDTATYHSHSQSISGSASAGPSSAVSLHFSQRRMDSHYLSAAEQAGIQAGDGGFQITVKGDTKLLGSVIAGSDQAVREGRNTLTTATLQISDLTNQANYDATSISLGAGYSKNGKGVGSKQSGEVTTPAHSGNQLASRGGITPAIPLVIGASGEARSMTRSAISGAEIVITDEARQIELTGQSAAKTIAGLNRNVAQSHQALAPIFDRNQIEVGFDIVNALGREAGTFVLNRVREADHKIEQAERLEVLAGNESMPVQQQELIEAAAELREQAQILNKQWGAGGTYRRIVTALTAAASGNVTGTAAEFTQAAALNYLQSLGAEKIKHIADNLNNETTRAALHGALAYGSAVARGQSGGSAALGASASVLVNNLLGPVDEFSEEEKEARKSLVTSLVVGLADAGGADATSAQNAAQIEIENNAIALAAAPLVVTPPGFIFLGALAAGIVVGSAYEWYKKDRANNVEQPGEDEDQIVQPAPPPMVMPMEPQQPFQIPGRAWHQDEEVLLEGMPNQSGEHIVQPLVMPREVQSAGNVMVRPLGEELDIFDTVIFSKGVKEEKTDERLVNKIFGGNRTSLENITSRGTKVESIPDGTRTTADADFDALGLSDIRAIDTNYGQGRVGNLPDGTTVIVRPSRDGRPTIEFQSSNRTIREIRYGRP